MAFNDPLSPFQWYLNATGAIAAAAGQKDLGNLEAVWADYIGRNIKIGIYDSGVDVAHPDLAGNYLASLNPTFNGAALNPNPTTGAGGRPDAHGTAVAGIIAGIANNSTGIAGIAYGAKFGVGLAIGSRNGVDVSGALIEQMRLQTNFDVVNHSWGYTAPFSSNQDAQGPQDVEFIKALQDSAANGRGGLGTIMVVSAGNGRQDDVNAQGNGLRGPNSANDQSFENSRFIVTVAAADRDGRISDYSDPGASILITGFGGPGEGGIGNLNVFATDITGADGYNNGTQQIANQTIDAAYSGFNGTSAAAPTVTAVIALMLEANPSLGWRDVKEILALSASHTGSAIGTAPSGAELYAWKLNKADNWNGGGLHFSEDYGFGLINARNAVRLAENWTGTQRSNNEVTATASASNLGLTLQDGTSFSNVNLSVANNIRVETAEVKLTFNAERVRDLRLDLVSPSNTVTTLIRDLGDNVANNVNQPITYSGAFTFSATSFMEEKSQGTWTLRLYDTVLDKIISVSAASLTLYGEALSTNDTYFYNDEFGLARSLSDGAARATLSDTNGGIDTINAAQLSGAAMISLVAGATSTIGGATFQIAADAVIENVIGGDGADTLTGNAAANILRGNRGNDVLNGGDGIDTAVYKGLRANYTITQNANGSYTVTDTTANRDGTDTLTNIEQLQFSDQVFALSADQPFPALFAANLSQGKAIAAAYQTLLGGTPGIAGFDFLIKANLSTNFGAGAGPVFNDENIFINVANSLVQGNATAAATFNSLASGATLAEKIASLYSKIIPVAKQTADGVAFLTRPDGLKFYQDVAKERGITAENGPAVVAMASLLKVAVDGKIGIGNPISDLIASIADGSSELPATSQIVLPIETIDGTKFDADDAPDVMPGFTGPAPAPVPLIGWAADEVLFSA